MMMSGGVQAVFRKRVWPGDRCDGPLGSLGGTEKPVVVAYIHTHTHTHTHTHLDLMAVHGESRRAKAPIQYMKM